ncbi:SubName: Full=Related to kinesin light chain {ECO:0000313/EMBL:CCA74551.1} [Serendipita indica DSM 11827]|nr:SubName: Full=Related to kinesin light chain {ECO:0000313/EMBL:CCA74551.1} [Serendipita indica DSM 11827]
MTFKEPRITLTRLESLPLRYNPRERFISTLPIVFKSPGPSRYTRGGLKGSQPPTQKPKSKLDDLGFLEIIPGTDPIVDIVALHGLQGHREGSWTAENGIMWLRDLLPNDLPNARILSYGYDADTRSQECVSTQTIDRHGDSFVKALSRKRSDVPRRPIIFIAHDLGGIILKWGWSYATIKE